MTSTPPASDPAADRLVDSAPHLPPDEVAGQVLSGGQHTTVWVGRTFLVMAAILSVWIVFLAITLPSRGVLAHQDVVWVGFDIGLLTGLVSTAWSALRRNRFLPVAASATAALLLMDAWFDVVGSGSHGQRFEALVTAVLVELPLSGLCWWIALHAQAVAEHRIASLVVWRRWSSRHGHADRHAGRHPDRHPGRERKS